MRAAIPASASRTAPSTAVSSRRRRARARTCRNQHSQEATRRRRQHLPPPGLDPEAALVEVVVQRDHRDLVGRVEANARYYADADPALHVALDHRPAARVLSRGAAREHGAGGRAAEAEPAGVSLPAVALAVRELEHELDAILFDRRGGGVSLTAAGKRFHALAGPLLDAMDALLVDFVDRVEDDMTGRVVIAASVAGAAIVLPRYVKRLRERYPGVRLRVRNSTLGEGLPRSVGSVRVRGHGPVALPPWDLTIRSSTFARGSRQ